MPQYDWIATRNFCNEVGELFNEISQPFNNPSICLFTMVQLVNMDSWATTSLSKTTKTYKKNVDNTDIQNNDTLETFQIERSFHNNNLILYNFHIDYQKRPYTFEHMSPYNFCNKVGKEKKLHHYQFLQLHLQNNSHSAYKYRISKTPIMQGFKIPSINNDIQIY